MPKKRMMVLASHEPTLDPRLHWIAQTAADRYDVSLIGFQDLFRMAPRAECANGYKTSRIPRVGVARALMTCWDAWRQRKRLESEPNSRRFFGDALLIISLLLALPVLASVAGVAFALRWIRPLRWCAVVFQLFRRAFQSLASASTYDRTRDRFHRLLETVRTFVWRPVTQNSAWCLPVVRPLVRALSRFTARIRHFFLTIDHFLRTTAALIHAISNGPRPDILYCNDLDTLIAGVWLRDHFDCPLVYDAHEFWAYMTPDALWFETAFWLAVERQFAARADAAFTVSPQLAAAMREATGVPFRSAPNCEPHRARAPKSDLAQLGLLIEAAAKGRVRFLFQGNFEHHRGIEEILRGWTLVDSKRAVLFLRGPKNSYRDDFIQLAAELKVLEGSVFFLDAVCETDLIAAARFADVGIISYKPACLNNRLACPNKTSQYMQAGLAILTNKLDYVKQIVADFQCGLAYDSDLPESFAAAVNRFVDDGGFLRACQQKGQTASADVFNWEVQSRDLFETCDRLAGVEKPRAAGIAA